MLLNIHNEESLRIRNKKFSSEWPFNRGVDSRQGNGQGNGGLVVVWWVACGKNVKKLVKKKRSSKFFWTEILEVGLRPKKKVAKYSGQSRPETNFSVRPSGGGRKILKFALGAEMASYGPDCATEKLRSYYLAAARIDLIETVIIVQKCTRLSIPKFRDFGIQKKSRIPGFGIPGLQSIVQ
jgi:hypothetical protein